MRSAGSASASARARGGGNDVRSWISVESRYMPYVVVSRQEAGEKRRVMGREAIGRKGKTHHDLCEYEQHERRAERAACNAQNLDNR